MEDPPELNEHVEGLQPLVALILSLAGESILSEVAFGLGAGLPDLEGKRIGVVFGAFVISVDLLHKDLLDFLDR